jgi:hypothetical protein
VAAFLEYQGELAVLGDREYYIPTVPEFKHSGDHYDYFYIK